MKKKIVYNSNMRKRDTKVYIYIYSYDRGYRDHNSYNVPAYNYIATINVFINMVDATYQIFVSN